MKNTNLHLMRGGNDYLVKTFRLSHYDGDFVVFNDINLELCKGRCTYLLGDYKSSKTLLKILNGCSLAYDGSILFGKRGIKRAYIDSSAHDFNPRLSVLQNFVGDYKWSHIFKRASAQKRLARQERAIELLRQFSLSSTLHQRVCRLMPCQIILLFFLRRLMNEPDLLLVDDHFGWLEQAMLRHLSLSLEGFCHQYGYSMAVIPMPSNLIGLNSRWFVNV